MTRGASLCVVVGAIGAFAAVVAYGCATASQDAGDPNGTGKHDSSAHDGTYGDGGGGDVGGPDGTGRDGPLFESGPLCGDLGAPNTCEKVEDLGTFAVGDKKSIKGNVNIGGGDVWYKVTFGGLDNPAGHPHIVLSGPDAGFGFLFEVVKTCHLEDLACGPGEGISAKLTDFEVKWAPDPAADGGTPSGDAIVPLTIGVDGAILVRVFRTGGAPTACDGFTLDISN